MPLISYTTYRITVSQLLPRDELRARYCHGKSSVCPSVCM